MGTDKFYSREVSEDQKYRIGEVQHNFAMLYDYMNNFIPEGREKSLYTTKLEEACMWAEIAISNEEKEEGEVNEES